MARQSDRGGRTLKDARRHEHSRRERRSRGDDRQSVSATEACRRAARSRRVSSGEIAERETMAALLSPPVCLQRAPGEIGRAGERIAPGEFSKYPNASVGALSMCFQQIVERSRCIVHELCIDFYGKCMNCANPNGGMGIAESPEIATFRPKNAFSTIFTHVFDNSTIRVAGFEGDLLSGGHVGGTWPSGRWAPLSCRFPLVRPACMRHTIPPEP
jgi:hypothetical protein